MANSNNNAGGMYAGAYSGFDPSGGVGNIAGSTLFSTTSPPTTQGAAQAVTNAAGNNPPWLSRQFVGEPLGVWVGFLMLLFLLKWLSERKESNLNPAYIKIGGYNVMAIGLSAAIFIIVTKVIFNRFNVPGVTEFANAL